MGGVLSQLICIGRWKTAPSILPLSIPPPPPPQPNKFATTSVGLTPVIRESLGRNRGPEPSLRSVRDWDWGQYQMGAGHADTPARALPVPRGLSPSPFSPSAPAPKGAPLGQWLPHLPFPAPHGPVPTLQGARHARGLRQRGPRPGCTCLHHSLPLPPGAGPPPLRSQCAGGPVRAPAPWPGQLRRTQLILTDYSGPRPQGDLGPRQVPLAPASESARCPRRSHSPDWPELPSTLAWTSAVTAASRIVLLLCSHPTAYAHSAPKSH